MHDRPRQTFLQKWYLIISEPHNLVSRFPTFKLYFFVKYIPFFVFRFWLYHRYIAVTIWTVAVRRESFHNYPQPTKLHSRLLLSELATFVGHMARILCIVESRIRKICPFFLRVCWNVFQVGVPHIAAAWLGMTLWKDTHKELAEPEIVEQGPGRNRKTPCLTVR